jgi:hypothetical protein
LGYIGATPHYRLPGPLDSEPLPFILVSNPYRKPVESVVLMLAESFLAIVALTALMVVGLAAVAKLLFSE